MTSFPPEYLEVLILARDKFGANLGDRLNLIGKFAGEHPPAQQPANDSMKGTII